MSGYRARNLDTPERRKKQIAAIQIAVKQLDMERGAYKAMLLRVSAEHGGKRPTDSSKELDFEQRGAVLDELRRLGAARPPVVTKRGKASPASYPGKPRNFDRLPDMITKVEALLAELKAPWSYADGIAKRMFGVEYVAWLRKPDQLKALIASLHVELEKRSKAEAVDSLVAELRLSEKDVAQLTGRLPKGWRRDRRLLDRVIDHLQARAAKLRELEGATDGA